MSSNLSLNLGGFCDLIISLRLPSETKFMIGFFLVGLSPSIPVLSVIFYILISSNERFASIDSYNFDYLSPLINNISFIISLYDSRFDMIKIIDSVLHIHVVVHLNILRIKHSFVLLHVFKKLYNLFRIVKIETL